MIYGPLELMRQRPTRLVTSNGLRRSGRNENKIKQRKQDKKEEDDDDPCAHACPRCPRSANSTPAFRRSIPQFAAFILDAVRLLACPEHFQRLRRPLGTAEQRLWGFRQPSPPFWVIWQR